MNETEYYARRYNSALETIDEQAESLRHARHLIWTLFVLLALTAFALGGLLASNNFGN